MQNPDRSVNNIGLGMSNTYQSQYASYPGQTAPNTSLTPHNGYKQFHTAAPLPVHGNPLQQTGTYYQDIHDKASQEVLLNHLFPEYPVNHQYELALNRSGHQYLPQQRPYQSFPNQNHNFVYSGIPQTSWHPSQSQFQYTQVAAFHNGNGNTNLSQAENNTQQQQLPFNPQFQYGSQLSSVQQNWNEPPPAVQRTQYEYQHHQFTGMIQQQPQSQTQPAEREIIEISDEDETELDTTVQTLEITTPAIVRKPRRQMDWLKSNSTIALSSALDPKNLPNRLRREGKFKELERREKLDSKIRAQRALRAVETKNKPEAEKEKTKLPTEKSRKRKEIDTTFSQKNIAPTSKKTKPFKDKQQVSWVEPLTAEKVQNLPSASIGDNNSVSIAKQHNGAAGSRQQIANMTEHGNVIDHQACIQHELDQYIPDISQSQQRGSQIDSLPLLAPSSPLAYDTFVELFSEPIIENGSTDEQSQAIHHPNLHPTHVGGDDIINGLEKSNSSVVPEEEYMAILQSMMNIHSDEEEDTSNMLPAEEDSSWELPQVDHSTDVPEDIMSTLLTQSVWGASEAEGGNANNGPAESNNSAMPEDEFMEILQSHMNVSQYEEFVPVPARMATTYYDSESEISEED